MSPAALGVLTIQQRTDLPPLNNVPFTAIKHCRQPVICNPARRSSTPTFAATAVAAWGQLFAAMQGRTNGVRVHNSDDTDALMQDPEAV